MLVSEVMLQQTQVDRVKNYWKEWLERWPTFENLATASTADVIRAWKGLGYNRRAVNLQRGARFILEQGGFDQFQTVKALQTIPGIGHGTAGALMNFVWNVDTPFLEVNLKRIFQRLAVGPETVVGWAREKDLLEVATAVLPHGAAHIWPHALMDFGALACRPWDPFCTTCPLNQIVGQRNKRIVARKNLESRISNLGKKPKTMPFEETNRYWRGRILDLLRAKPLGYPGSKLLAALPDQPSRLDPDRFQNLVHDLIGDGLLIQTDNRIQLPD